MNPSTARPTQATALAILIAVQGASAAFFAIDWLGDMSAIGASSFTWHAGIELLATLSLVIAIGVEARVLMRLLRREAHMARSLSAAAKGLNDLMEDLFATWGLTPAEQDVATFLIKGSDIAEIARLRGSAEGTIKAHLNAIYRKAGVSGRPALVSLLLEDLMVDPLLPRPHNGDLLRDKRWV
ncbi:MAG: helix-turn-helix transcriptional regulator [Gemmobacter sp.]